QFEECQSHGAVGRARAHARRHRVEGRAPRGIAGAVRQEHHAGDHRYRTSQVKADIDSSRYSRLGTEAASQGVQSCSRPRCPATLFSSTKLMPSITPPNTFTLTPPARALR